MTDGKPHPEPAKPSAPPEGAGGELDDSLASHMALEPAEVVPAPMPAGAAPPGEARVLAGAPGVSVQVHGQAVSPGMPSGPVMAGKVKVSVPHAAQPQHVRATLQVKASESAGGTIYPGTVPRAELEGLRSYVRQTLEMDATNMPMQAVAAELTRILGE